MSDMTIIHVVSHSPAILFALVAVSIIPALRHRVSNAYRSFLALDSCSPFAVLGYFSTMLLRPLRQRNPLIPPTPSKSLWLNRGYLETLPQRDGTRPEITDLAPQRQLNQLGSADLYAALSTQIRGYAATHDQSTYLGWTTFEQNSPTLFSRSRHFERTNYYGEICHAHPSDGSVHVNLHPADIVTVIANGWGERHPLAGAGACSLRRGLRLLGPKVSTGYTMIYAPRNEAELQVCGDIIKAAVWWVGGVDSKRSGGKVGLEPCLEDLNLF